jgi:hypothetical protein
MRAAVPVRAAEIGWQVGKPRHTSISGRQLEQPPVGVGETLEELAQLEMVAGHGADLGDQFLSDVFGAGFLVHLGGEMVAALGGVFVEGTLEQV